MLSRAVLLVLLMQTACASKASQPRARELAQSTVEGAPPELALSTVEGPVEGALEGASVAPGPSSDAPDSSTVTPEPVEGAPDSGWSSTVELVDPGKVTSFRWLPSGSLMFEVKGLWKLFDGKKTHPLDGEPLEEALASVRRTWEGPKFKWKVHFEVFWSEGNLKCEDLTGEVAARLEVCLRKAAHRCNVHTFTRDGKLPFPWAESEAPSGIEALDILAFPKKNRILLGRRDVVVLFTLDPLPQSPAEVKAQSSPPGDTCEAYESVLAESTFTDTEVLEDLFPYTSWITGTAYTIDGTGYLYGGQGGVWLGRFSGPDPVRVVEADALVVSAAWSPSQDRIAFIDSKGGLHVAAVTPPGLTEITLEESAIK